MRLDRLQIAVKRDTDVEVGLPFQGVVAVRRSPLSAVVAALIAQECTVDYVAWESNIFTVESFNTLSKLYSHNLRLSGYPSIVKKAEVERNKHVAVLAARVSTLLVIVLSLCCRRCVYAA